MVDYSENIDNFSRNPKTEILNKIKEIQSLSPDNSETDKFDLLKKYLEGFLLDYELYCFEEAWKELSMSSNRDFALLKQGIEENFGKKFGSLSFECRRVKLLKYLEKK